MCVLLGGCTQDDLPLDDAEPGSSTSEGGDETSSPQLWPDIPIAEPGCEAPPGISSAPETIEEAVALVNALPKPVTIPCFLQSLQRPLDIELTRSVFSAQPAGGADNPRIFIFSGDLIMSVVPEGEGAPLLEFGERIATARTIKAELVFPLEDEVPLSAAFDRVRYADGTGCGLCHRGEEPTDLIPDVDAFVSNEYQPTYDALVELDDLVAEYEACNEASPRCEFFHALFDHGPVRHRPFEEEIPTIFDE